MLPPRNPLQASITRVSHRWHRVFFSEPALWRRLTLTIQSLNRARAKRRNKAAQWFACTAGLLRRVGGLVQRLRYIDRYQDDEGLDSEA